MFIYLLIYRVTARLLVGLLGFVVLPVFGQLDQHCGVKFVVGSEAVMANQIAINFALFPLSNVMYIMIMYSMKECFSDAFVFSSLPVRFFFFFFPYIIPY